MPLPLSILLEPMTRALTRVALLLVWVALLPTVASSEVKAPWVTVDMTNLGRPEYAPLPTYPKEARIHSWGGFAIYEVHCQFDGKVAYVFVRLSTGHPILDEAGKAALAQWHWHGGRFRLLAVPMTFNPGNPPPRSQVVEVREENKEFTAGKKAGLTYTPGPPYPLKARKNHWIGRGKFELRFNADGTVSSVLMLESTGHDLLDETCKETLANWRSRPGLFQRIQFPITFSMDDAKE